MRTDGGGGTRERLADGLPQWHLLRDEQAGAPLRALLDVIAEQVDRVRGGVERQYDDWFIETAADEIVPYLGDLVGYAPLPGHERIVAATAGGGRRAADARRLAMAVAPRRDVAATVGYRRRKGTLALLEEIAESVAGWPARAVELSRLVAHCQPVRLYGSGTARANAARAARGRLVDLRDGDALDLSGTPFGTLAKTVDVRRAASRYRPGGYTPSGVSLRVWPRKPYSVTRAPAFCVDRARNLYTFSILGSDTPLVAKPEPEPSAAHIATVDNVPARLRRRLFAARLADFYGPGKSVTIWRDGEDKPIPLSDIVVADLSDWRYRPRRGQVAVDPERGRIAFGVRSAPRRGVWVTYHYAFGDDLGGGEYPRASVTVAPPERGQRVYRVGPGERFTEIMDAFRQWRADRTHGRCTDGVIEITDSGAYQERFDFDLKRGDRLTLRAADGTRPVLRLLDWYGNRPDALNIRAVGDGPDDGPDDGADDGPGGTGGTEQRGAAQREGERHGRERAGGAGRPSGETAGGAGREVPAGDVAPRMTLDGLVVVGRGVLVSGPVGALAIRHCTLVPGWSLEAECAPAFPDEPSLVLERTTACIEIDRSVLGAIAVIGDEVGTDPLPVHVRDSVLDATGHDRPALSAVDGRHAHAVLHARRTTVIGEVHVHAVRMAENSVFTGRMHVARRQIGCLRYSYVPPGSRTPRRHRCQPDLAGPGEAARVRPVLASERYGTPDYAQLAAGCAEEIVRGAEDGAEMGVFHDLFQPQRADNLRARLLEYTPAGADVGISFVS